MLTPKKDYQWGFSFLQLFVNILLLLSWLTGTWLLWLKAYVELSRRATAEVSDKYRAVLDLAAALNQSVSALGDAPGGLGNEKLTKHIESRLRGGAIKIEAPLLTPVHTNWAWFKQHKEPRRPVCLRMRYLRLDLLPNDVVVRFYQSSLGSGTVYRYVAWVVIEVTINGIIGKK